jgi:hypothetical protein
MKYLVCIDGGAPSGRAFEFALEHINPASDQIILLNVIDAVLYCSPATSSSSSSSLTHISPSSLPPARFHLYFSSSFLSSGFLQIKFAAPLTGSVPYAYEELMKQQVYFKKEKLILLEQFAARAHEKHIHTQLIVAEALNGKVKPPSDHFFFPLELFISCSCLLILSFLSCRKRFVVK